MKPAKVEILICFKKHCFFCDVSFGWYEGKKGPQMYNNMMMGPSGFWIAQRKEGPQRVCIYIYIYMMGSKLIG
jgi:hypothetical protein